MTVATLSDALTMQPHEGSEPLDPAPRPRILKSILRSRHCISLSSLPSSSPPPSPLDSLPPPPPASSSSTQPSLPPLPPKSQRAPPASASISSSSICPSTSLRLKSSSSSSSISPPLPLQPLKLSSSELESSLLSIASILCDTTTHDWQRRISALHQLSSIALGCSPSSLSPFLTAFRPLRPSLSAQILDLRSSVVKETCHTLTLLAQLCRTDFSDEADVFLPLLIRLVSVSVQVIATSGDESIRQLMKWSKPKVGMMKVMEGVGSVSAVTRERCMEYVLVWMEEWKGDVEYVGRWESTLYQLIGEKVQDKTEAVRATARKAALMFGEIWEDKGKTLLEGMEDKVRRVVEEERKKRGWENDTTAQPAIIKRAASRKSMSVTAKAPVKEDKENTHPNTLAVTSAPQAPRKPSAPPQSKPSRRSSFTVIQSVTAADGEAARVVAGGGSRLGGAQRVLTSVAIPVHPLPPRPRRTSVAPLLRVITSHESNNAEVSSAPSDSSAKESTSSTMPPSATVSTPPAPSQTAYEALLTSSVSSDLHAAIDAAFAEVNRKPRIPSNRRQSQAIHAASPPGLPPTQEAEERRDEPAPSAKRKSLGPAVVPSTSSIKPQRRASLSLSSTNEAAAAPRPVTVSSLLLLARDTQWSTRVSALERLTSLAASDELEPHVEKLTYGLIERMTDSHHKVAAAALSTFAAVISSLSSPSSLLPHLSALFPPLFLTLAHPRPSLRQQSNDFLNLLSVSFPHVSLLPPVVLALTAKDGKIRRGAEEFFQYLLEIGNEDEKRKKVEIVEGLPGDAGKRARTLLNTSAIHLTADISKDIQEEKQTTVIEAEQADEAPLPSSEAVKPVAEVQEKEVEAVETMALSLLLSPHHPINQPPSVSPPPVTSAPAAPQPIQSVPPASPPRSRPPLSPAAEETVAQDVQQQAAQSTVPMPSLAPPSSSLLSPLSAPQPSRPSHSRAPSAPSAKSAFKATHRPSASLSLPSQSRSKKRLIALSPPSLPQSTVQGSSKVLRCDAYDGRLSDADVSGLIYQWKHAEGAVVLQSLQWMQSSLNLSLSHSSIDRIVLTLIEAARRDGLREAAVGVLSILLTPSSPHWKRLSSASFPHVELLLSFLLTISREGKGKVEGIWMKGLELNRTTVLPALITLLSSSSPVHSDSLFLLLSSLHQLIPPTSPTVLSPLLPALSSQLTMLLCHDQVLIRKAAVRVWVCIWEVIGDGVERWLEGMGGVSRKLVEIYLNKAREEKAKHSKS